MASSPPVLGPRIQSTTFVGEAAVGATRPPAAAENSGSFSGETEVVEGQDGGCYQEGQGLEACSSGAYS